MKIAIDPGHGMGNRRAGVFDPGCTHSENGVSYTESDIVKRWAFTLDEELRKRGVDTFVTRKDDQTALPVGLRAQRAKAKECTHLLSIHVNDADSDQAHGTETLWRHDNQKPFAAIVHAALMAGLNLRDRGLKERDDLAVLSFDGPACLIEVGFIANDRDRAVITDEDEIRDTCSKIADAIASNG